MTRQDDRALEQRKISALERIADSLEGNAMFPSIAARPKMMPKGSILIQTPAIDPRRQSVPDVTETAQIGATIEPMTEDDV
jgi:hypothetical protein